VLGDLQVELARIRQGVSAIMEEANPTLKRRTEMIVATVWLGVIELRIRAAQDSEKRRDLTDEFWKGRNTIEKIIAGYRRQLGNRNLHPQQEPRRALS